MAEVDRKQRPAISLLLLFVALVYLCAALAFNEFALALFDPSPPLDATTASRVRSTQLAFLLCALVLGGVGVAARRSVRVGRALGGALATNLLLVVLSLWVPLSLVELGLRPFVPLHRKTTIFSPDSDTGWRLRAGARDEWGGVIVSVNRKGVRGPELDYAKPDDTLRILYLGDSVTFGFGIEDDRQTFPYRTESILEANLGCSIETVNAAVGGWSPWQQDIYFRSEGVRYDPDLVVVGFVLNDVTEKFGLVKFGGGRRATQLRQSAFPLTRWLEERSALVTMVMRVVTAWRFGADVHEGGLRMEELRTRDLVYDPDRGDIQRAWSLTLDNLGRIYSFAAENGVPVVLVVMPSTFQFDDPEALSAPQKQVTEHAREHGVPFLDMLPVFVEEGRTRGRDPAEMFIDGNHPTADGAETVATALAAFISRAGVVRLEPCRPDERTSGSQIDELVVDPADHGARDRPEGETPGGTDQAAEERHPVAEKELAQ